MIWPACGVRRSDIHAAPFVYNTFSCDFLIHLDVQNKKNQFLYHLDGFSLVLREAATAQLIVADNIYFSSGL